MKHTYIGGSNIERRMNCPGSVDEFKIEQQTSTYAAEGTRLHKLMERAFEGDLPGRHEEKFWIAWERLTRFISEVGIMKQALEVAYAHPRTSGADIRGTFDFVGASHDTTYLIDYKFGDGVRVSPVENLQLSFYAQGVIDNDDEHLRDKLVFAILQPWRDEDPLQMWEVPEGWMDAYARQERAAYQRINSGERWRKAGKWCRWCGLSPTCPEASKALTSFNPPDDIRNINPMLLADLLAQGERAAEQYKRLEAFAKEYLHGGGHIPGKKLIETWGHRKWTDEKKVAERYPDIAYDQKVRSPAQIEKVAKQKGFDISIGDLITRGRIRKMVDADHKAPEVKQDLRQIAEKIGLA